MKYELYAAKNVAVQVNNAALVMTSWSTLTLTMVMSYEQFIIESMVNQSLNERLSASVEEAVIKFQAIQQQINDTIDEKIVDSHRDTCTW